MDMDEVRTRVGFFRNKINLSARKLSERIGKSESFINKFEAKDYGVSLPTLFEIIDALDITCEEFFADNYATYKRDKELFDFISSLKSDSKDTLFDLARKLK